MELGKVGDGKEHISWVLRVNHNEAYAFPQLQGSLASMFGVEGLLAKLSNNVQRGFPRDNDIAAVFLREGVNPILQALAASHFTGELVAELRHGRAGGRQFVYPSHAEGTVAVEGSAKLVLHMQVFD